MPNISITLPSDGSTADVADYNTPLTTIKNVINGNLDSDNISSLNGSKITAATIPGSALDTSLAGGWLTGLTAPNTVTYNGNRNYSMVFNSVDYSSTLSAGMRLRTTRTVAAPTQCTSLNGTTQYYSKSSPAGMTFTDDFAAGAWVKLSSYPTTTSSIISRTNGTSGWSLFVETTGQIFLNASNAAAGNYSRVTSYQSLPLNEWVHITAQLDMSAFTASTTTSYIMIDGVDVPCSVSRAGTNPTALPTQVGNLEVGSYNGGTSPFPGKIAQAFVTSAKLTQTQSKAIYSQGITTADTATYSMVSAYSFNGVITDLNTTNANNLTANGSAVATATDSPFGTQASGLISSTLDYAEITSVSYSTNTTVNVRVPEGNTIPTSGGVSSVVYSSNATPYGWPGISKKLLYVPVGAAQSTTSTSATAFLPFTQFSVTVPQNCRMLTFGGYNSSFSASGATMVMKLYNGPIATANELVQINRTNSNEHISFAIPFPVVPGEVLDLRMSWLVTGSTGFWATGAANRQAPALWIEAEY